MTTTPSPKRSLTGSPLWALSAVRFLEFAREPGAVFWTFGFPLLITVALGIAFRDQGPPRATVALVDGPRAAEVYAVLATDPALDVKVLPAAEANARLRSALALL